MATSYRRLSVCSSDVAGKFQIKHSTTSRWNVTKTSQWDVSTTSYWNVVTTSQSNVTTTSHQYVSTTSQKSLKWNTQRCPSGTLPRRLMVRIYNVPLARLYDVCCKSQIKHRKMLLWYVSTTSWSYVFWYVSTTHSARRDSHYFVITYIW